MGFLGSIGKAIGGAISGFIGTGGNPWGAVVGGIGGLLGGGGGGGGDGGGGRVGTYIPPTTQEAYNIIKGLEGQVDKISNSQYNLMKPYLDQAYNLFRHQPDIINRLFGNEEFIVANRYSNLFNSVKKQMENQWSKSALGLSALGLYNTPATQLTQSDIVNQLYGRVAESELKDLNAITDNRVRALLGYYTNAPQFILGMGETLVNINPEVDKFNRMLQLAGVLQGLSSSVIPYQKTTPLQYITNQLNEYIKNHSKELPDFGQTMGNIFNGVSSIFSRIGGLFH
jgi:hypothetical protein